MGLLAEVELPAEMLLELVGQRLELQQPGGARPPLREPGCPAQKVEVEIDLLDDAGPANLHHHHPPGLQERRMDLRDRRGRERVLVDPREVLEPDVVVDRGANRSERHGRDLVHQLLELVDVDVRQEIRA